MSRWYQHVLSGERVEVKSLEEDDFYAENVSNWARVSAPAPVQGPESGPVLPPPQKRTGAVEPRTVRGRVGRLEKRKE